MLDKGFVIRNKVSIAIIIYLAFFFSLHFTKPSLIYNSDGSFREFGVGFRQKTVLPIWIFAIVLAILSYLAVSFFILYG